MHRSSRQQGSAHTVIIVVLVIALLAALGFVFWQNVIKKDSSEQTSQTGQSVAKPDSQPVPTLLDASFNSAFGVATSFQYPSDWKLTRTLTGPIPIDENGSTPTREELTVTSPSGEYVVTYRMDSIGGVGGTCDLEDTPYVIGQLDYVQLDQFKGVSLNELIIKNNTSKTYTYDVSLKRSSFSDGLSAGDRTCMTTVGLAGVLGLDKRRMFGVTAHIVSLDDDKGVSKNFGSLEAVTKSFSGIEYEQTKAILLSTKSLLSQE